MAKLKNYIFGFLLLELFFSYAPAYAQSAATADYSKAGVSDQIAKYLCVPNPVPASQTNYTNGAFQGQDAYQLSAAANNSNSGVLFQCINQLYKFAIVLASVIGVFFRVIAGYVYMSADGNKESVDKAKSILTSTITSLVILLGGYVLLKAINPDLIQFQSIQPPSVTLDQNSAFNNNIGLTPTTPGGATGGGASVQAAAQTLLSMNGSKLSINSTSCDCSGNCPSDTLQSLANGQQATADGPGTACNVTKTNVSLNMLNALITTANAGTNFTIDSITGGHHSGPDDPHYKGLAVDVTPSPATITNQQQVYNGFVGAGANVVAAECDISGQPHIYTVLNSSTAISYMTCVGKSGYHLHAQWPN